MLFLIHNSQSRGGGGGGGGQEGWDLFKSTHQTPFISISRKRIKVELEYFFGMIWIRISDPFSRITVHQMKHESFPKVARFIGSFDFL